MSRLVPSRVVALRRAPTAPPRGRRAVTARAASAPVTVTAPVSSVLGSMTMGWTFASEPCDDAVSERLIRRFVDAGHSEIDTAVAYAGGETERILGRVLAAHPDLADKVTVATKVNPWPGGNMTSGAGEGGLAPAELEAQVDRSLESLGDADVDLLYLHAPDAATPIERTLEALAIQHERGAFRRLGLSNFAAWECVRVHAMCDAFGLPRPDTYQGMYNCVTRAVEPELLPALRALDMRFLAYNPLAGGLLTGKHEAGGGDADKNASSSRRGRFSENKMYLDRFWRPEYFAAVDAIAAACGKHEGLTVADASLLWLYSHSRLDGARGDGVVLGASSEAHLEANLGAAARAAAGETLPDDVLDAIEAGFEMCAGVQPPYSRGHSRL